MVNLKASRQELLAQVRKKTEEMKSGRRDPDQFIPPKVREGEATLEYTFNVLPELMAGDHYKGGVCKEDQPIWYHENGTHYMGDDRYACPRIHDHEECPLCKMGFDLLSESDNKEYRKKIIKQYLASGYYAINIYFPDVKKNPEAVRGKVMWFNIPKSIHTKMEECINNDDQGDEEEPKAFGIFYHPNEGYRFRLSIKHKGGYNDYSESGFITKSLGPLVKTESGEPDEKAIQQILDQRHYLPEKFRPRDVAKLQAVVNKLLSSAAGDDTEEIGSGDDEKEEMPAGLVKGGANKTQPRVAPKPSAQETSQDDGGEDIDEAESVTESKKQPEAKSQNPAPTPTTTPTVASPKKPTPPSTSDDDDPELATILNNIKNKKK